MMFSDAAPTQRLERQAQATADANGNASFAFEYVPETLRWTGTAQIPGAPKLANFTATVGVVPWGAWSGGLPFGPIQVDSRERLVIAGQGLNPGVAYTAVWVGVSEDDLGPLLHPAALATPPAPTRAFITEQTITANFQVLGPFDCSSYPGARFKFVNEAGGSQCSITLVWYDTLSAANAPTAYNFAGQREVILDTGDSASFEVPHAGDFLLITLDSFDAGTFVLHTAAAHRDTGIEAWFTGPDPLVYFNGNLGTGTQIPANTYASGRFGGPAWVQTFGPTGGSGYQVFLQALYGAGADWRNIWTGVGGEKGGPGFDHDQIVVPPFPLRWDVHNNSGGTAAFTLLVQADGWR